ncbi:DUF222 domain-containing protein [Nocardioides sp. Bht2]|uniref:DUF222 domain-containing protein n=1 Tax=Nocardioides sp. Bht2 TaxID=3392297 RepID=UPI0039B55469
MNPALSDLDAAAVLAAAVDTVVHRRLVEVHELCLLAQWAALHSGDVPGGSRNALVQLGGEGTPKVQDHCLGEIALARGTHTVATTNALADVLDLRHRLPEIWAAAQSGIVDLWIVRKVAKMSRQLPLVAVGLVDAAVARMLGHEGGGRILEVAEAKIIEADIDAHHQRLEDEKRRRYVSFTRTNEHGLRTLIAQIEAGDAAWIEATLTRIVEILRRQGLDTVDRPTDEWRAIALGYLARPAELLALLAAEVHDNEQPATAEPDAPEHLNRAIAFPAELLAHLRQVDWRQLAPRAVLYLHLHEGALVQVGDRPKVAGVVRVESVGNFGLRAQTLDQLHGLLRGAKVTVKPVIDLANRVRTIAYEHPEALKEQVFLAVGGDYWPYANSTSRKVDYDHVTAYWPPPPPGAPPDDGEDRPAQTGNHNSGPLTRTHHRWKTHAGYRARQAGANRYVWTTPNGLAFMIDHQGTHRISREEADLVR